MTKRIPVTVVEQTDEYVYVPFFKHLFWKPF